MITTIPTQLMHPQMLFALIPAVVVLIFLISKSFLKSSLTPTQQRRRRSLRWWMFVTRMLIVLLLITALAVPYGEQRRQSSGNPSILLLVDNSTSMEVFDTSFIGALKQELERYMPVTQRNLALGERSALGDGILQHLEQNANLLLITDGRATHGTSLEDVGLYATNLNVTISTIDLRSDVAEAAVSIVGPSETLADVENTYAAVISGVGRDRVRLTVQVDDEIIIDEDVEMRAERDVELREFTASFPDGYHRITARISGSDHFEQNNEYYKIVKVLEKPKILYLGDVRDPLVQVLEKLYDVDRRSSLPDDLSPYYTIIINDQPASIAPRAEPLHEYLIDEDGDYYGNGLVVIGGFDSFERGNYQNSPLESLLPVRVGKAEKTKGNQNLMFVIDVSGGLQAERYVLQDDGTLKVVRDRVAPVEIIKNRVVEILEVLDPTHRVGATAFGISTVGGSFENEQQAISKSVLRLEPPVGSPLNKYYDIKKDLIDKVVNINGGGASYANVAYRDAINLLSKTPGDKRVILLTDGEFHGTSRQQLTEYAESASRMGIETFVIGVGRDAANIDETYLRDELAKRGGGVYIPSREINKIKILFGDPENKQFGDDFTLFYLSLNHFITQDLDARKVYPILNGWNQVVPKAAAQLLVTTDAGDPALSTWRYGNGRVAALTIFRGDSLGPMLSRNNSIIITRITNWAIGDPERKQEYFLEIPDAEVGIESTLRLRTEKLPSSDYLEFVKEGPKTYTAEFIPAEQGFNSLLGVPYATNYLREYRRIGIDPQLRSLSELSWDAVRTVESEGASLVCSKPFKPEEAAQIVECAKTASKRIIVERTAIVWPLIVAALVIYLAELIIRRRHERHR